MLWPPKKNQTRERDFPRYSSSSPFSSESISSLISPDFAFSILVLCLCCTGRSFSSGVWFGSPVGTGNSMELWRSWSSTYRRRGLSESPYRAQPPVRGSRRRRLLQRLGGSPAGPFFRWCSCWGFFCRFFLSELRFLCSNLPPIALLLSVFLFYLIVISTLEVIRTMIIPLFFFVCLFSN